MTSIGWQLGRAAESLVGTAFRLHGRDPAFGIDCVGVLTRSLQICGLPVPTGIRYGLRNATIDRPVAQFCAAGFASVAADHPRSGDVLLAIVGPAQFHVLMMGTGSHFIHAHAGMRRVVAMSAPLGWPIAGQWRFNGHRIKER